VTQTNLAVLTFAFQKAGIVDELQSPTAAQAANGLTIMNGYLLSQNVDGMRLGYYPQTNLQANIPIKDADIYDVQLILIPQIATAYGITLSDPVLIGMIDNAERRLTKRSIQLVESDLGELSRPQGGPWGGPNWL
jgi:hypothetical protein